MSSPRMSWMSPGVLVLLAGCLHHGNAAPRPPRVPPQLPPATRSSIEPEFGPSLPPGLALPNIEPPSSSYRAVTANEARCLAVRASSLGNQFEAEREQTSQSVRSCGHTIRPGAKRASLHAQVLGHAEEEARNQSAALALEAYFRLIEAEGRLDLVRSSLTQVDTLLARVEEVAKAGQTPPQAEIDALQKQQGDLRANLVQLRIGIEQGNRQMKKLLGLDCDSEDYNLWPSERLTVEPDVIDLHKAIARGLEQRADLRLLRTLLENLSAKTLPEARLVMGGVNLLLGGTPPGAVGGTLTAIFACLGGQELESVRAQLQTMLDDREKDVRAEIIEKAREVEARLVLILLARQRLEKSQKRVAMILEKIKQGQRVDGDLGKARLEMFKAQGELLQEIVAWEIARVHLFRAQGLLPLGCEPQTPPEPLPCLQGQQPVADPS